MLVVKQAIVYKNLERKKVDCFEKLATRMPGTGDADVLRVRAPELWRPPQALSLLLSCVLLLHLGISCLLCPLLQTPSSRKSSQESHPFGCAFAARGSCFVQLHAVTVSLSVD